jgi:hypothetical protein
MIAGSILIRNDRIASPGTWLSRDPPRRNHDDLVSDLRV